VFCKNVSFDRESKRIGGQQALAQGQGATGVHASAAPEEDKMAVILFGTQQAQQQKGQQSEATCTYEEFKRAAVGAINLRGRYITDENNLRVEAKAFLNGMMNDEHLTLTPCLRYRSQDEGDFVSPLTRARGTGWAFGDAGFISVNTMVGLISPGLQLPEYRATRANPRPTGQVNDGETVWIVGPWAPRSELKLYVTDGKVVEALEGWIERRLQSVN
jgi:hypothetical protein